MSEDLDKLKAVLYAAEIYLANQGIDNPDLLTNRSYARLRIAVKACNNKNGSYE